MFGHCDGLRCAIAASFFGKEQKIVLLFPPFFRGSSFQHTWYVALHKNLEGSGRPRYSTRALNGKPYREPTIKLPDTVVDETTVTGTFFCMVDVNGRQGACTDTSNGPSRSPYNLHGNWIVGDHTVSVPRMMCHRVHPYNLCGIETTHVTAGTFDLSHVVQALDLYFLLSHCVCVVVHFKPSFPMSSTRSTTPCHTVASTLRVIILAIIDIPDTR